MSCEEVAIAEARHTVITEVDKLWYNTNTRTSFDLVTSYACTSLLLFHLTREYPILLRIGRCPRPRVSMLSDQPVMLSCPSFPKSRPRDMETRGESGSVHKFLRGVF
jgi:hypothetical protein